MSFYKEVPGRQTTLESTLKFDTEPKAVSTNPVTSDGVKSAIDGAVGDASAALQEQIDDIAEKAGSGYIPKGEASVATLNALSGQENGELYTMTDAGTLTEGSLAVVAGDTVAWDATNEVWYKAMDYAPRQYGTNEAHNLPTTITAFRTGDVIPVDGPSGTAKMSKDDLLRVTAENSFSRICKNLENLFQIDSGITISGINIDRGLDENGDYNNNVVGHARTGRQTISKNCAVVLDSDVFCFRAFSYSSDSASPWSNYLIKKYKYGNILITNSSEPYYSFEFVRKDGGAIVSGDLSTIESALKVYDITDASLSTDGLPADAKKTGDEITKIKELDKKLADNLFASEGRPIVSLTVGSGIRDGNGETYSNTARMRTGRLDSGNQRLRIQCDGTKYLMSPHYYTTDSGAWTDAYTGKYDDYTDDIIIADPSLFVGILIKRVDGADVSSTDAETFLSSVKVSRTNSVAKKVVRILGVGNSHTRDVFRWLWKIADSVGVQVILGQAYLGGTTLKNHYDNILSSSSVYTYEKYVGKDPTSTANVSMNEVIEDEPWDICIMQQASYLSGVYSSFVSPEFDIKDLIDKIKELCTNKLIKFGLACDWANVAGFTGDPEWIVYYGGDPEVMYEDIQSTIPQVASYCGNISYITNQGKAFKIARDNQYLSAIGDDFSRDKNHADYGIGRYCAGMVYAISLLGIDWNDVTWFPTSADDPNISNSDAFLANLARQAAFAGNSIL